MKIIYSLILVCISSITMAETFNIGGTNVVIPAPKQHVKVIADMDAVYRFTQQIVDPVNDTLAYYIHESDVPMALSGGMPKFDKYFLIKVHKALKNKKISQEEFDATVYSTQHQMDEILQSVKKQIPSTMNEISAGVSDEFDIDFALNLSSMVPLEPHYKSDQVLSFSMYIKYNTNVENQEQAHVVAATSSMVFVADKLIFLYSYSDKENLEWTRQTSKDWVARVLKAN